MLLALPTKRSHVQIEPQRLSPLQLRSQYAVHKDHILFLQKSQRLSSVVSSHHTTSFLELIPYICCCRAREGEQHLKLLD